VLYEFGNVRNSMHPQYEAFLVDDSVFHWKVVMCGPKSEIDNSDPSPYNDGVFVLNVLFPPDYPATPPECRFKNILHVNVNSHGKICHDLLSRAWDRDYSMSHVLNSIYALLLVPEVNSPVQSTLAALYHTNPAEYIAKIEAHVFENASKPLDTVVALVMKGQI
jgi:ubiquitin-protein ligase